jgi:hypothetical protein
MVCSFLTAHANTVPYKVLLFKRYQVYNQTGYPLIDGRLFSLFPLFSQGAESHNSVQRSKNREKFLGVIWG